MAVTRRRFLQSIPLGVGGICGVGLLGCAGTTRRIDAISGYREIATVASGAAPKATIVCFMPETAQTKEVWTGLTDELGPEYKLVAIRAEGSSSVSIITEGMARHRPSGVVLMNNPTVAAYRAFQRQAGAIQFPPAVIVMTSFLDGQPTQIASATGISYEVPLITAVTNLRKLIATPIDRVGVILRGAQQSFVARQTALARREQISVIEQEVSSNSNASELKWALRRIKHQVDALWILNDDRLLSPRLIADGWLPGLNERPFCPTIVGAASLVAPAQSFGTFAVLPDHAALGVQTANLMFDLAERGWLLPSDAQVELPLSTTTTVDLVQARARFSLRAGALRQVDRILE